MDNDPVATGGRISYKWLALAVASIARLMGPQDGGIIRIVLPALTETFETEITTSLWVMLASTLVGTGLMLTFGRLGDTWGRKRVYTIGLAILAAGLTLCSMARSIGQLIGARVVQSVGNTMAGAMNTAIVVAAFPRTQRGLALGILAAMGGVGGGTGPVLGGLLLDNWGWRSVFWVRAPVALAGAIGAWLVLVADEPSSQGDHPVDLTGAITLFLGLCGILFAINQGYTQGWTSPLVLVPAIVGLIMMPFFLWTESRVESPVLNLNLFRIRNFVGPSIVVLLGFVANRSRALLLPFFLIQARRFSATLAGLILTIPQLAAIVLGPFFGWLSDKMGTRLLTVIGLVAMAAGTLALTTVGIDSRILDILMPLFVIVFGASVYDTPNSSALMGSVTRDQLGTASAMIGTGRTVGQSAGTAVWGTVYAARRAYHEVEATLEGLSGHDLVAAAILGGFRDAILASAVVVVLILPLFLLATMGSGKETAVTTKTES